MSRPLKKSDPAPYIQIGRNIAEARERSGMTREELADKLGLVGLDGTMIDKWETEGVPTTLSLEALFCIAEALGVKAWGLLK